jgi:hypothetical protein
MRFVAKTFAPKISFLCADFMDAAGEGRAKSLKEGAPRRAGLSINLKGG